jgi:NADPH-dependent 2,4-dienoyl-CoA reductase/sulfur reductase-like enzyme
VEALRRRAYDGSVTWIGAESTPPYDRPPLSKQVLRGEWDEARVALKANYEMLAADLRLGRRAVGLDARERRVQLDDGTSVAYDGLVIATGATARTLSGCEKLSGVHTLRTLHDAIAIRSALAKRPRVAVVGAGFIGLEVAASCRALGLDVTVVEVAPVPLGAILGERMGETIRAYHESHGVVFRTATGVVGFIGTGDVEALRLSDGSELPAELVVVGIGVTPEIGWLEGSGVTLDRGVLTDAQCRTNVPGIVACGDVARSYNPLWDEALRVEHWTNAVEQANAAAASLLDAEPPAAPSVPYFWSDQYDAKIQFAGRVVPTDTLRVLEGSVADRNLVALYERAGKLRGVLAVNKPAMLIKYRRAIGEGAML